MMRVQEPTAAVQANLSDSSAASEPPSWSASSASDASATTTSMTSVEGATAEQISRVRASLEPGFQADDVTVGRFIRATGGNLPLSVKRLNATLAWRSKVKPEQVICKACVKNPRSHYMHLVGYCQQGRPIIYSCLEAAENRVFEDNRDHMIQTFEMATKCMPPGVEQWIWVCDFKGFGMADVNPRLAKLFLDISSEHYPERLGLFLVVDAPSLFGLLWKAISPFVDPKTYKKIRFLPFDAGKSDNLDKSRLKHELDLHLDSVTTSWFIREMNENREKSKVRQKVYNMYSVYELALNGELCNCGQQSSDKRCHHGQPATHAIHASGAAACDRTGACGAGSGSHAVHASSGAAAKGCQSKEELGGEAATHNLMGTLALLHAYNLNPDLLLPQATGSMNGPGVPNF